MKAYGAGDDDDAVEGDFSPGKIAREDLTITLELFRYCPEAAESGWDTLTCSVPGHATLEISWSACNRMLMAVLLSAEAVWLAHQPRVFE